jgi:hypothetical protein
MTKLVTRSASPLILAALLAVVPCGLSAQQAQSANPAPAITFKSGVEAVTVTVAVRDQRGRVLRDLRRTDFEVFDSGRPRQIQDFYSGEAPISLAIVLDVSGSMAIGHNIERARHAVHTATAMLTGGNEMRLLCIRSTPRSRKWCPSRATSSEFAG